MLPQVEMNKGIITVDWVRGDRKLLNLSAGDVFMDSNCDEYLVCEQFNNGTTAVVRKALLDNKMKFGETNDWRDSDIRKYLNGEYLKELIEQFGEDNIVELKRDLISLDGYDDYGKCQDKASVMSIIEYMKYHKYIGNCDRWHYLLTPDSTPSSGCVSVIVQTVRSNGSVDFVWCGNTQGVRPFFILKSSTCVY